MAHQLVHCKYCNGSEVVRYGTQSGSPRFRCKTDYVYRAYESGVKDQIVEMAVGFEIQRAFSALVKIP